MKNHEQLCLSIMFLFLADRFYEMGIFLLYENNLVAIWVCAFAILSIMASFRGMEDAVAAIYNPRSSEAL